MNKTDKENNYKRFSNILPLIEKKSDKILELGPCEGELMSKLKEKGNKVVGLDIYPNKILLEKGFDIKKWDLNKGLPFKDSSFDVVIGLMVIEHLFNPYEMMKEIRRVLKPNGYAIIALPNSYALFIRIGQLYEKRIENIDLYWHHYQFCIKSIRNLISKELVIEKVIYGSFFRRLKIFNPLLKMLVKMNKNIFAGEILVKARKKEVTIQPLSQRQRASLK